MRWKVGAGFRFFPLILVMGTIFLLSGQPADSFRLPGISDFDKLGHGAAYGVLALSAIYAFGQETRSRHPLRVVCITLIFSVVYGVSDEYHQHFVPGRTPSGYDLLADAWGAGLACLLWLKILRNRQVAAPGR